MGAASVNFDGASFLQCVCGVCDGTGGIDHIVNQDNLFALYFTNDVHNFTYIGLGSAFIDDGNGNVQLFSKFSDSCYAAQVGRYCNKVFFQIFAIFVDIEICQKRAANQVVHRDIKEALDLCAVQVHCQHTACTGACQDICNQFCTDGISCSCFSILTGIAIVRHNCCDSCCGCTFHGIDHDQQFHQVVIYGIGCGLDDEYIGATDGFIDFNGNFTVLEFFHFSVAQFQTEFFCNGFCQFLIGIAGKHFDVADAGIKHKFVPL